MVSPLIPLVGFGLSALTSIGTSMYNATRDEPEIMGPTGEQKMGQGLLQQRANELASMGGLSETEYNRPLDQVNRQVAGMSATGMEQTRSASPFMSNVVAERIAKQFSSQAAEAGTAARKEMTSLDIQSARENLKTSIAAQSAANQQANQIAQIEQARQVRLEQFRNQKMAGIVSAAGQAAAGAMKMYEIGSAAMKADATPVAQAGATTATPTAVMTPDELQYATGPAGQFTAFGDRPMRQGLGFGLDLGIDDFEDQLQFGLQFPNRNPYDTSATDRLGGL